jgi:hypothetical protein
MTLAGPALKRVALGATLLGLLGGCQDEGTGDLPNDFVWRSPHFVFHARARDAASCPEVLTTLEQHFEFLHGMLGFIWPTGRTIQYYKFADSADFSAHAPCPRGAGGCADGNDVYSYDLFEQHELVHTYLWPYGLPPPLVAEGTAVALACNRSIPDWPALSLSDAIRIRDPLTDTRLYDTGGRLVRHLLDSYGPELFMRFYPALRAHATFVDLDRALRGVFGAGADEIWAAALATPASCPPPFACSRDTLPGDGTPTPVAPTCGPPAARTFALAADGNVAISGSAVTTLGSCDSIPFSPLKLLPASDGVSHVGIAQLPAGHYHLDVSSGGSTALSLSEASQPWAGSDCSALQPFVVGANQYPSLRIVVPDGSTFWAVKLRFLDPHLLSVPAHAYAKPFATGTLTACPDCDFTSPLCQAVDLSSSLEVLWQGDYVLGIDMPGGARSAAVDISERW